MRKIGFSATAAVFCMMLVGCGKPKAPQWTTSGLDTCQKAIEKQVSALDRKLFAALKKCKDKYRSAVIRGQPLLTAATACDTALSKTFTHTGTSAVAKARLNLEALTSGSIKCSDEMLVALGHLPTTPFGNRWSNLVVVARLKAAIEGQLSAVRDTFNVMTQLAATGACPRCNDVAVSPCSTRICSASGSLVAKTASTTLPFDFAADLPLEVCDSPVADGAYGILARPQRNWAVGSSLGTTTCVDVVSAAGFIGGPQISYTSCQDHRVEAPETDECAAALPAGSICTPNTPDSLGSHSAYANGGVCVGYSSTGGGMGTGMVSLALRLTPVLPAEVGPDGVVCTEDDLVQRGDVVFVPLTTGTAVSSIYDANGTNGTTLTSATVSGTAFPIVPFPNLMTGTLSGGKLVGALPMVDASALGDTVATLTLTCS